MNENDAPVVMCEEVGRRQKLRWRFCCRYCKTIHSHSAQAGHRVAHCVMVTPYTETGYVLQLASNNPEERFAEEKARVGKMTMRDPTAKWERFKHLYDETKIPKLVNGRRPDDFKE